MNCIKCKEEIHAARLKVLPKTKVCVNCSTAEAVSCVDVIYHKTGNTFQIMDKESADKINKLAPAGIRSQGFSTNMPSIKSMTILKSWTTSAF